MGKKKVSKLFWKLELSNLFTAILYEFSPKQYHWLCFEIKESQRGKGLSPYLMNLVISRVRGTHHIHILKELKTLKKTAKALRWRNLGDSEIYFNATCFRTRSKRSPDILVVASMKLCTLKKFSKCPRLKNFVSEKEKKDVIDEINHANGTRKRKY